jgi:hypothetical protein
MLLYSFLSKIYQTNLIFKGAKKKKRFFSPLAHTKKKHAMLFK